MDYWNVKVISYMVIIEVITLVVLVSNLIAICVSYIYLIWTHIITL